MIHYTIGICPTTKKNSQQIFVNHKTGKPFITQSQQYRKYEQAAGWFLRPRPKEPINEPCNVKMVFYMPTRRRVDLPNLQNAILDILVKYKVLEDDNSNIVASMDGSMVLYNKNTPRTEIYIESWRERSENPSRL